MAEEAPADKDDPKFRGQVAFIDSEIGNLLLAQGKKEDALKSFIKAKDIRVALWRANDGIETRQNMALAFEKVGNAYKALGDYEHAWRACDNDLRARKGLIPDDPSKMPDYNVEQARYNLSTAYARMGNLELTLGNPWDAEDDFWRRREVAEKLVKRDPSAKYLQQLSYACNGLGNAGPTH